MFTMAKSSEKQEVHDKRIGKWQRMLKSAAEKPNSHSWKAAHVKAHARRRDLVEMGLSVDGDKVAFCQCRVEGWQALQVRAIAGMARAAEMKDNAEKRAMELPVIVHYRSIIAASEKPGSTVPAILVEMAKAELAKLVPVAINAEVKKNAEVLAEAAQNAPSMNDGSIKDESK